MSGVPYTFGNATTSIPLSQLDVNFATNATIGTTSVGLGNTTTTLVGLTNVSTTVVNASNVASNTSLLLQTNGTTTAVTIDTAQNVGVGVTPNANSGSHSLQVGSYNGTQALTLGTSGSDYGTVGWNQGFTSTAGSYKYLVSDYSSFIQFYSGQHRFFVASSGTAGATISATQAMTLDNSGNLYLGTTSQIGGGKVSVIFSGATQTAFEIEDSGTNSGAAFLSFRNSGATQIGYVARVGTTNAVVYGTTSDYRLKNVVGAVTGQGERIDALKPIDYTWKDGGQNARGFLAHEFQAVYADSVTGEKDAVDADGNPVYQGMQASTPELIADLVAEIQSLRARLKAANIA